MESFSGFETKAKHRSLARLWKFSRLRLRCCFMDTLPASVALDAAVMVVVVRLQSNRQNAQDLAAHPLVESDIGNAYRLYN